MQIKFSLVDDDEGVRQVVPRSLQSISGFTCVGCYASGAAALAGIPRAPGNVVLMDIRMPGMSGIECTRQLKILLPQLPVVMLTGHADDATIHEAMAAGASGYLTKPYRRQECAKAMREAVAGGAPLCREAAVSLVSAIRGAHAGEAGNGLSLRERELLRCLFEKLADKEIAGRMEITPGTVHVHLRHMFAKLKVHTRAEAVRKYLTGKSGF